MKKTHNIVIYFFGVIFSVLITLLGLGMFIYYQVILPDESEMKPDPYVEKAEYIRESKTEMLIYGDDVHFRKHIIMWTPLTEINLEKIHSNYDNVYLIINDWDHHVDLSDNDCNKLLEFADENPWFSFVYIGKDKLNIFNQLANDGQDKIEDSLSFGYEYCDGRRVIRNDIWDQSCLDRNDITLMGDNITSSIYRVVTSEKKV